MSRKTQPEKQGMSAMQKQAVLVCAICVLAALLTVSITLTLLKKGKEPSQQPAASDAASVEEETQGENLSEHYQINNESAALLTETGDAGEDYLNDTLFLGDSNTVRLYNNGLISLQQFCAKEGIGTQGALSEGIVTFKKDSNRYTIAEAVAKMKPRRVVMTFGTNDTGMEVSDFIANYTALVQAIQASYPYTDIIVNTVPPVPENHSNYPHMDQTKIDDFNMALLSMCEQLGLKFLNSAEVLKGEDGYGIADYYNNGDIHLKTAGLKVVLNYIRTHAYSTEDRRPDTSNIPTRTLEYTSNPSSAVQAPSSSEAVSSSESTASSASSASSSESTSSSESKPTVKYEASYRVEKSGGGSLSCGSDSGKTLNYTITDSSKSLTVTAVPAEGYVFVKWSDGVTSKTRTDSNFKQNLDVTAVFASMSVKITGEKSLSGNTITFRASVSGKYGSSDSIRWYANGIEVKEAAGLATVTVRVTDTSDATYKVHAVVSYNDCSVSSNTVTITIVGNSSSGSSSSSSSSASSSSSSTSGASSGSTSSSSDSGSGSSHSSTSSSESSSHSSSSTSGLSESSSSSHSSSSGTTSSSASESKSESKADASGSSSASSKTASSENTEHASSGTSASSVSSSTEASAGKEASSESKAE